MRKFNLSLDDFSPHPKAGLNFESIVWCDKLIKKYPGIKINLFVPAAYCRIGEEPCYLTANPEWVKMVKALPDNYRINLHGLFHRRTDGKHPVSNNDEFQYLSGAWVDSYIDTMMTEFKNAGLEYEKTFRPPGWKISLGSAKVLTSKGFIIAGNGVYHKLMKGKVKNLRWVSYNWDMTGVCKLPGNVVAYGHTSEWTNNYMDEARFMLLDRLLKSEPFDFRFIEELI